MKRYWLTTLLVLIAVMSAMLAIQSKHQSREHFYQLQTMRKEQKTLQTRYGQLLLEQGTLAAPRAIEDQAVNQLGLKVPSKEEVVLAR